MTNSKVAQDAPIAAEWIARMLVGEGYCLNFSIDSLHEIDRFFDEHAVMGKARSGGLLADDLGRRIFSLGSYVGEVIGRESGGIVRWRGNDSDPRAEINLAMILENGLQFWPIQKAMKRFRNGKDDSIHLYGLAITESSRSNALHQGL